MQFNNRNTVKNTHAHTCNYTQMHNMYEKSVQAGQIPPKTAQVQPSIRSFVNIHKGSNTKWYHVLFSPPQCEAAFVPTQHPASPYKLTPSELRCL